MDAEHKLQWQGKGPKKGSCDGFTGFVNHVRIPGAHIDTVRQCMDRQ